MSGSESSALIDRQHSALPKVCSALDNEVDARSVLDMTNTGVEMECVECGLRGTPDLFEIHNFKGPRGGGKYPLPRCKDRKACDRRVKQDTEDAHRDELVDAARELFLCREAVKEAEKELAYRVQAALKENVSATAIARAAGISRERVYQIRDGRR